MRRNCRNELIETAAALFCRDGYQATGIDRILAESGCAKMTLYNHFHSKDELILAALRRRDEEFRNWFMREIEQRARTPRERLLAAFDVLDEWLRKPGFSGCMFVNASAEFSDPDHPVRAAAAEHKRLLRHYFRGLATEAGARDPQALADAVALLGEGAVTLAHVAGERD
ncbi:MAG: TetR/AcrR family transcriptional regulator, partial [Kiloniellales bacterium]